MNSKLLMSDLKDTCHTLLEALKKWLMIQNYLRQLILIFAKTENLLKVFNQNKSKKTVMSSNRKMAIEP